jgi:hypothetical protein
MNSRTDSRASEGASLCPNCVDDQKCRRKMVCDASGWPLDRRPISADAAQAPADPAIPQAVRNGVLSDEREPAPPNSLPDWGECAMRVNNSEFLAKRIAEGGFGPDADSKLASELHRFIYEYDDADPYRSAWFLHRLERLLDETRALSAASAPKEPTEPVPEPTAAARDVLAERQRQISAEGWTPEHDDQHAGGEMAMAAACYAAHSSAWQAINYTMKPGVPGVLSRLLSAQEFVSRMWPWDREWWKPKDERRNLVRAGALIVAEIERLDRAAMSHGGAR